MKSIVFWAASPCRSIIFALDELAKAFGVPGTIAVATGLGDHRAAAGWSTSEFAALDIVHLDGDAAKAQELLQSRRDSHHFFTGYQRIELYRELMLKAAELGLPVAAFSEAPLNMARGSKRTMKDLYLRYLLPGRVKQQVAASEFLVNLSGSDSVSCERIGWAPERIVPYGYFPPPLEGSSLVQRGEEQWRDFTILSAGIPTWHRGPDLSIKAVGLLRDWGLRPKLKVTMDGGMMSELVALVKRLKIEDLVDFVGRVPKDELLSLYQTNSCFVATGRAEPWGIRVNDALHNGSPLVISRGMGASDMVLEYGCGATFQNESSIDLATQLARLMTDREHYLEVAGKVPAASRRYLPADASRALAQTLRTRFPQWIERQAAR